MNLNDAIAGPGRRLNTLSLTQCRGAFKLSCFCA